MTFNYLHRILLRLRYPVSMPQDIADDLGLPEKDYKSFEEFVRQLTNPECRPTKLRKFMSRDAAESSFHHALRKERFANNTLFSFYFNNEGWIEFDLLFDDNARLRRLYLQHKQITQDEGIEIPLERDLNEE